MTVTVNWGPQAGFADTGTVQSVYEIMEFLFDGSDNGDEETVSFTETSILLRGTFNNQTISMDLRGTGFAQSSGGGEADLGTITSMNVFAGDTTDPAQSIGVIEFTLDVSDLVALFQAETDGDSSAVEDYFTSLDWTYNGTNLVDNFPSTATSADGDPLQLNGNDLINLETGDDLMFAGAGNDTVNGGAGFDTVEGGDGDDMIDGGQHADLLYGQGGNDHLIGGAGFDNLHGGAGNDTLDGGEIADRLFGGDGDDVLMAGSNFGLTKDGLYGEAGNDTLYGEAGFDNLYGGEGDDLLDGGFQADNLYGGEGNDTMMGGAGLDRSFGGNGNDIGYGGDGTDGLFGEMGDDTLYGENGNDRFFGGQGRDSLFGGADNDSLYGGAGFDTLDGGTGDDTFRGDFNADVFVFADGHGNDTIEDFAADNIFEKIDLSGVSAITDLADLLANHASPAGSDVLIDTGSGNSILLNGVSLGDLDSTDFIFA